MLLETQAKCHSTLYQSEGGERRIGPLRLELLMLLLLLFLFLLHRLASAFSSKLVGETPGRHVTLVREPFFIFFCPGLL